MKVTEVTREALAARREIRRMKGEGYQLCEPDWKLIRGGERDKVIVDVAISLDRQHIWFKTERPAT